MPRNSRNCCRSLMVLRFHMHRSHVVFCCCIALDSSVRLHGWKGGAVLLYAKNHPTYCGQGKCYSVLENGSVTVQHTNAYLHVHVPYVAEQQSTVSRLFCAVSSHKHLCAHLGLDSRCRHDQTQTRTPDKKNSRMRRDRLICTNTQPPSLSPVCRGLLERS